jgi:predicted nucleotidyltransferase
MDRDVIKRALEQHFANDSRVAAVYLYGSFARGTERSDSDIDVGVLYVTPPPSTLLGQPFADEGVLESVLGRPTQLVVMNGASPDLVHRILLDGILVVDSDRRRRIAFEVKSRNKYFDLLPVLQLYRRREVA